MNWLLGVLLTQYMISATAGLACQVRGAVNMAMGTIAATGSPVETGPHGLIELQLHPGSYMHPASYLRLRENSSAVFDYTALTDIVIRLNGGFALIDTGDADPQYPIQMTAVAATVEIRKSGIY